MRIACLVLPNLAIQLCRQAHEDAPRMLVLLAGDGDGAVVTAVSPGAQAIGITVGMTALAARARCPSAWFGTDNAGNCIEMLESIAAILRLRATNSVAIGGADHIFVSLSGLEALFPDEALAAAALAALVRSWSGLDVRAGVAATRANALDAARRARRAPVVVENDTAASDEIAPWRDETVGARYSFSADATAKESRARLVRMLTATEAILAGREESFREIRLTLQSETQTNTYRLRSHRPLHRAAEAVALLANAVPPDAFESVSAIEVELGRLGPTWEVVAAISPAMPGRFVQAPARPVQARLLRAS
jgi:hypothetical protein